MLVSPSFNVLSRESGDQPCTPAKTLSSSEGGGDDHPMMQSLPMPIQPRSLRTTSLPHPSSSCDGSGATWPQPTAANPSLSNIAEQPSLGSSPRQEESTFINSRAFADPESVKSEEGGAHASPTVTHGHRPIPLQHQPGHLATSSKPRITFLSYLREEATPFEKEPQKDVLWGQTERDRVYQYLLLVPFQLERLLQLGFVICVDTLLGTITLLPLRCLFSLIGSRREAFGGRGGSPAAASLTGGGRIFDFLSLLILISVTLTLKAIRPGFIYYWLKDLTNEFLKMGVLSMAFDIFDRILSNFGVNVLEALSSTCTLYASKRIGLAPLICDTFVAYLLSLAHAFCLMCQASCHPLNHDFTFASSLPLITLPHFDRLWWWQSRSTLGMGSLLFSLPQTSQRQRAPCSKSSTCRGSGAWPLLTA